MNNIKIEIKKSEIKIIKEALDICATLYDHDCWLGYNDDAFEYMFTDGKRRKCPLEIKFWDFEKSYKISQLKKLAMIEHRIVTAQVKKGWLKKTLGNLRCWWRWTTSDENWRTTKFAIERQKQRKESEHE